MAITIPVTHAAKQKNSRRSPKSTGMFTPPPCSLCLTIFVGTGRNGNSLSIMGHESLQTSYPKMPALNSERSRSFGVNEAVARSAQDWRGFLVNFIPAANSSRTPPWPPRVSRHSRVVGVRSS
jgi:hypothetical protein